MATFTCPTCSNEFTAYNLKRRYCSRACSSQAKSDRFKEALRTKACLACGRPFLVAAGRTSRLAARSTQRFCSVECQWRSRYRRGSRAAVLSRTDAAYFAGFIDGEGSVMLFVARDSVRLRVTAANTHRPSLEHFQKLCRCGSIVTSRRRNPKHKDSHWWQVNAEAAESLLRQLLPFLVTKKRQAALGIAFQERLRTPALKADRTWQRAYLARMQALNRRGPT